MVSTTRPTRLQLRVDLRDLHPFRHRLSSPARDAASTRPRCRQQPDQPGRTLHQTPQPNQERKMIPDSSLDRITYILPGTSGLMSSVSSAFPSGYRWARCRTLHGPRLEATEWHSGPGWSCQGCVLVRFAFRRWRSPRRNRLPCTTPWHCTTPCHIVAEDHRNTFGCRIQNFRTADLIGRAGSRATGEET
jgi:hypothetical protein